MQLALGLYQSCTVMLPRELLQHQEESPSSVIVGDTIAQPMLLSGTDENRLRLGGDPQDTNPRNGGVNNQ